MTTSQTINFLRALFVAFACFMGVAIGGVLLESRANGAMAGLIFGLLVVLADRLLKGLTLRTFSSAIFGLLLGLLVAHLLIASNVLQFLDEEKRWVISLLVYVTVGYLGMMLAMRSSRDEFSMIVPYVRFQQASVQEQPLVIDTNIILDGRLPELCATGFISTTLVVPRFVLEELQRLGDSHEPLKRERGRRGLETVDQLQRTTGLEVTIHESAIDSETAVDMKLIQLTRLLNARLLSNDGNLCKVARLQRVPALNLNELSNALRPRVSTGDEIELALVKEGRDAHQAVGFLPDGTMIVVNHARALIGTTAPVTIAGSLQTSAGRLYFAELDQSPDARVS